MQELQKNNFEHLKKVVEYQKKVRNCEIEGGVYDLESDLEVISYYSLISMWELDQLLEILKS